MVAVLLAVFCFVGAADGQCVPLLLFLFLQMSSFVSLFLNSCLYSSFG